MSSTKFKENDVVYWVRYETGDILGAAIVLRDQDEREFADYVRFKAWKPDLALEAKYDWMEDHKGWQIPHDDSNGIDRRYVFKHPDPDAVWADYCAAVLTYETNGL